jgi:hypothetical protein
VVADQWNLVASEVLSVVNSSTPPAPQDVSKLVRVHVNANGEAEFTIVGGSAPRTEVIPWKAVR